VLYLLSYIVELIYSIYEDKMIEYR